jgi:hypothetical protein
MRKFYKEGARRILAGQKKKSTIQIALCGAVRNPFAGIVLTAKRMAEKARGARDTGQGVCGKAEDGSGKMGHFFWCSRNDVILNCGEAAARDLTMRVLWQCGGEGLRVIACRVIGPIHCIVMAG